MLLKLEPPAGSTCSGERLVVPLKMEAAMGGSVFVLYRDEPDLYVKELLPIGWQNLMHALQDAAKEGQAFLDLTPEGIKNITLRYDTKQPASNAPNRPNAPHPS